MVSFMYLFYLGYLVNVDIILLNFVFLICNCGFKVRYCIRLLVVLICLYLLFIVIVCFRMLFKFKKFYGVWVGIEFGVYELWEEC